MKTASKFLTANQGLYNPEPEHDSCGVGFVARVNWRRSNRILRVGLRSSGRFLPDKAIDLMDEAGSRARIAAMSRPQNVKDIEAQIEQIRVDKEAAIEAQDFEKAAALRDNEKQAKDRLDTILSEWRINKEE